MIKYHPGQSHELGITTEQMYEIFAVANIVGGTIVIPHTVGLQNIGRFYSQHKRVILIKILYGKNCNRRLRF
jgi:hypothetical protein